ncbi:MAG: ferritin-like domain-containing protein, partial [Chloroflexi bacterium]|nr:ferritin-like domain-containing protein [Chloroflexota bacterium]
AAGLAAAGAGMLPALARADTPLDSITTILTIARTAERLAVTFYTNGVLNHAVLGLHGAQLDYFKAALIEEQLHELFFTAAGAGAPLASTFSFPHGAATFTDLPTFIATQQQLEGVFDSAFIAAVYEFSAMGRSDLARTACQIAMIESEHRVLGRAVLADRLPDTYDPADNWTYAPQDLTSVGAAPGVVAGAGYLSPTPDNTYTYQQVYPVASGDPLDLNTVAAKVLYQDGPFVAMGTGGGGGGGGAATPELGSGELLATGLLPIAGLLLYRRRKDAQARAARDSNQNQDTDDATS